MKIETERLVFREMTPDDYNALYAVLADSDIMEHYPYTFDESRVQNWIARNMERYQTDGFGLWAVALKETGEMIGDCGTEGDPTRVYTLAEIKEMMEKRGMELIEAFAGYTKIPASQHDFQMLVHSRKRMAAEV